MADVIVNYAVFNPKTGTYIKFNTEEEAKAHKTRLVNEWIEEKLIEANSLHTVNVVNISPNGNELWLPNLTL